MNITETRAFLEKNLHFHLELTIPRSNFKKVYEYALFPPGKLFRPLLVMALYEDFHQQSAQMLSKNHAYTILASALEIHHTYTLIHDDLPAMDNDDYRRGRLTTHKKFGQWQAILAADGLLNASYHLLSSIPSPQTPKIIKIISHLLGPKGLIEGQVIDLSLGENKTFEQILKMHELKTSRLIQSAILACYLLQNNINYKTALDLLRLGKYLGLVFQFLDDLSELSEKNLSEHEKTINPWINHLLMTNISLFSSLEKMLMLTNQYSLNNFKIIVDEYMRKSSEILHHNQDTIIHHLNNNNILIPIMNRLDTFGEGKNLA